jgi:hypothetical protein
VPVSRTVGETSVVDELVAGSLTPHILIGCCPGSNRRGARWRFR